MVQSKDTRQDLLLPPRPTVFPLYLRHFLLYIFVGPYINTGFENVSVYYLERDGQVDLVSYSPDVLCSQLSRDTDLRML